MSIAAERLLRYIVHAYILAMTYMGPFSRPDTDLRGTMAAMCNVSLRGREACFSEMTSWNASLRWDGMGWEGAEQNRTCSGRRRRSPDACICQSGALNMTWHHGLGGVGWGGAELTVPKEARPALPLSTCCAAQLDQPTNQQAHMSQADCPRL